ncbi:hypothetical protein GCM10007901_18950 [Dyella acidisoli]|uniref:Uncharacterized protein n=1 Tax=Dyella acidisoli TaxID=1867834 RepID=A0ABQ5XRD1_9GAMM|nr:hypothetical protein GCM10007901_18950 [Dyella acidisoli]
MSHTGFLERLHVWRLLRPVIIVILLSFLLLTNIQKLKQNLKQPLPLLAGEGWEGVNTCGKISGKYSPPALPCTQGRGRLFARM